MASRLSYVYGFDGLRAISVFLVVLFHFTAPFLAGLSGSWFFPIAKVLGSVGWVGVDVFFVISGYLIAKILAGGDPLSLNGYARFIKRRAARLLPAYIACVALVVVLALLLYPDSKVLRNSWQLFGMVANMGLSFWDRLALVDPGFVMVHFWSLSVEWHFYLLFPIVVVAFRSIARASLVIIALALIVRVVFVALGLSDNATYSFSLCRFDSLAIGALVATSDSSLLRRYWVAFMLLGLSVFSILMSAIILAAVPFKTIPWLQMWGYSAISVAVGLFIFGLVRAPIDSLIIRVLESKPFVAVGRSSYSIYIWHLVFYPLLLSCVTTRLGLSGGTGYAVFLLLSMLVTCVLGYASYKFIEQRSISRPPHRNATLA
ncbi:acyltransferase family protein [Pseudomonas piscis]|uniref:acyltransferase family protein n=1 Tax=Pseudomonas piscis TaxID=2614538 RepID=UPI00384B859E